MTKPWKRPNPKSAAKITLTPANLAWARARAKKAGRRYPNLIDNMAAARRQQEAAEPKTDWRKNDR
jgi:hypothetical protein